MKKTQLNDEQIQTIIKEYESGVSADELRRKYQIGKTRMAKILDNSNVELRTKHRMQYSDEQELEIANYYISHKIIDVQKKYHIGPDRLFEILDKFGVERRNNSEVYTLKSKAYEERFGSDWKELFDSKARETKMNLYGYPTWNINQSKQTCLNKYGVDNYSRLDECKEKVKNTKLERYGDENYCNTKKLKNTMIERYGEDSAMKVPELRNKFFSHLSVSMNKRHKTMKENNSYAKSKSEDATFELLSLTYGTDDVVRQYMDDRYPFNCDFYIKSLDLFIECNFHWTHGKIPFNENDQACLDILEEWCEKAQTSKFYTNALEVWTDRDVKKLNAFKQNNLNYKIYYNLEEVVSDINSLQL